jgi:hypothetical protein
MANIRPNVDGARGLTADRWRGSSRLPWAAVLEPTRSSRAQRRVHGGAAVETKRSGLKIPDDELSSGIKNPAKHDNIARFLEEAEKQERLAKELEDLKIAEGER